MSESETSESLNKQCKGESATRKRVRHRKKLLYEKLLKQMEFYFSDANLAKDRYLAQLVSGAGERYVPLGVFLTFNKIRSLTHDATDIAKAMKNSTLLELSDDKAKVKRRTPVQAYDAECRTIYVESIPVNASREWLEKVFGDFGPLAYISLPKFKDSQRIKGYGFVEFVKPEDAQKCLKDFTSKGCKLPTSMPPEELTSIRTFSMEVPPAPPAPPAPDSDYEPVRKKTNMEEKTLHKYEPPSEEEGAPSSAADETRSTDADASAAQSEQSQPADEIPHKKKRRKRSARERSKASKCFNDKEAPKGALWGLQVLSKEEWKALRNKYLNLQRAHMQRVKRAARAQRNVPAPPGAAHPAPHPAPHDTAVFVSVSLEEGCGDVRDTKRRLKGSPLVRHAELREGHTEAVLRFDTPGDAAQWMSAEGGACGGAGGGAWRARVLPPAEQAAQRAAWRRAQAARPPPGKLRGRQRLQTRLAAAAGAGAPLEEARAGSHIRFDDAADTH